VTGLLTGSIFCWGWRTRTWAISLLLPLVAAAARGAVFLDDMSLEQFRCQCPVRFALVGWGR